MVIEYELPEIQSAAARFWKACSQHKIFAFNGDMGAGKTTFIHALCDILQVKDVVGSPTFSLINEYRYDVDGTERTVFHMDLYRLRNIEEAVQAGIEDCFYTGATCFVEWPLKASLIFPPETLWVNINLSGTNRRRVEIDNI